MTVPEVVIDCAGAAMGGAARYLKELDAWLKGQHHAPTVVGRARTLSPRWLLERERTVPKAARRIALNNVGFARRGGHRVVLLRNALHFAAEEELAKLGYAIPRALKLQTSVVRAMAKRADLVVVPCHAMGDRVLSFLPALHDRVVARPHPVAPRPWAGTAATEAELLVPILNAPYKRLPWHLENIIEACGSSDLIERIYVTADAADFPNPIAADPRIVFVGRLRSDELDSYWRRCRAVYFPTQLESFGYPLAEARANGRRVVALDSSQNREIAGPALAPFIAGDSHSLQAALADAMSVSVAPDREAFDPSNYFDWLIGKDV